MRTNISSTPGNEDSRVRKCGSHSFGR
jgi:hypothetical protein